MNINVAKEHLEDFLTRLNDTFGLLLDARGGFASHLREIENVKQQLVGLGRVKSDAEFNQTLYKYPGPDQDSNYHTARVDEVYSRNQSGATNEITISALCIVWLYHEWDENFRHQIAESLGIKTKELTCDALGDIRHLRNSIIHNKFIADSQVETKTKVIKWFREGDPIVITPEMFNELVDSVTKELTETIQRYGETNVTNAT